MKDLFAFGNETVNQLSKALDVAVEVSVSQRTKRWCRGTLRHNWGQQLSNVHRCTGRNSFGLSRVAKVYNIILRHQVQQKRKEQPCSKASLETAMIFLAPLWKQSHDRRAVTQSATNKITAALFRRYWILSESVRTTFKDSSRALHNYRGELQRERQATTLFVRGQKTWRSPTASERGGCPFPRTNCVQDSFVDGTFGEFSGKLHEKWLGRLF